MAAEALKFKGTQNMLDWCPTGGTMVPDKLKSGEGEGLGGFRTTQTPVHGTTNKTMVSDKQKSRGMDESR